jgi:L-threonylcarbamoyladenylate synthase
VLRFDIDRNHIKPEVLERVLAVLNAGGLIVCPTETQYGLVCRADNPEAVDRLFAVKGRSATTATALFVKDIEDLKRLAVLTASGRKLAERFLPGPLTLVLEARVAWPAPLVVNGKIGIRVSPSGALRDILGRVPSPLTATSANRTGSPTRTTAEEIAGELGEQVDLYLEAGILDGPASTVVDCSAESVHILREGALSAEQIGRVLGELK